MLASKQKPLALPCPREAPDGHTHDTYDVTEVLIIEESARIAPGQEEAAAKASSHGLAHIVVTQNIEASVPTILGEWYADLCVN